MTESKGTWYLLGQNVAVVGGTVLVSHATNQVARNYLAIALGLLGGLILAWVIRKLREGWASRRVEIAGVVYLIALSVVSLSLDWFDPRGVIPAVALEVVALLRPLPSSEEVPTVTRSPNRASTDLAAALFVILAIFLLWLTYGPSPDIAL